jgi:lysozyme family protein
MVEDIELFEAALKFVLKWEGGYNDRHHDHGGPTNRGITQKVYDHFRDNDHAPRRSVAEIETVEVEYIYKHGYWLAGKCDKMFPPLDLVHFDSCVNFGTGGAAKFIQEILDVKVDGDLGPITLEALQGRDPRDMAVEICRRRIEFRHHRVQEDPTQREFLNGWLNRDYALLDFISGRQREGPESEGHHREHSKLTSSRALPGNPSTQPAEKKCADCGKHYVVGMTHECKASTGKAAAGDKQA